MLFRSRREANEALGLKDTQCSSCDEAEGTTAKKSEPEPAIVLLPVEPVLVTAPETLLVQNGWRPLAVAFVAYARKTVDRLSLRRRGGLKLAGAVPSEQSTITLPPPRPVTLDAAIV